MGGPALPRTHNWRIRIAITPIRREDMRTQQPQPPKADNEEYPAEEAARRRDAVLKIMVNTPPQPRAKGPQRKAKQAGAGPVVRKASGRPRKSDPAS